MIWVMLLLYRSLYRLLKVNLPHQADDLALLLIPLLLIAYLSIVNRRRWNSFREPARISYYFNITFLLLFSFQIVRLGSDIYTMIATSTHSDTTAISEGTDDISLQKTTDPDIYVIVLDGYGRQDVLQDIYDLDNSAFTSELKKLGFYVADQSHSNYLQTFYTMASLWNFEYLKPWNSSYEYTHYLLEPIQNNRSMRLLKENGYRVVSLESELQYTEIRNADVYLSNFLPLNKFESLLLVDTPLDALTNTLHWPFPIPSYKTHAARIKYQLNTLQEIPTSIPEPKIVYAHILAPHPPFVFDQHGNSIDNQTPYSLWDDIAYRGGDEEYRKDYREQVIFINQEILKVVKSILAKSQTPPVILIMGDHGPASMFTWKLDAPGCVWERSSNLYAILLPGHVDDRTGYAGMTPVNTFRLIFNVYFDAHLPLLEDRTYLMEWQQPIVNIDITDKRDSRQGCTLEDK